MVISIPSIHGVRPLVDLKRWKDSAPFYTDSEAVVAILEFWTLSSKEYSAQLHELPGK